MDDAGLRLIAQGVNQYVGDINKAAQAEKNLGDASTAAAQKIEKHATAINSLNSKINIQKQQFGILTQELLATNQKYGEGSVQSQKLDLSMQRLATNIAQTETKLEGEKKALADETEAQQRATAAAMSATQTVDKFGDETKETGQQVDKTSKEVEQSGQHFSAFREIVVGALREIGAVAINALGDAARAVGGFLKDAVTDAGDFEQGLNVLQAVTGATDSQMQALSKTSIALGNDINLPGTSAQDAADAMTELAKAGLSTQDAMDAARGTLLLATAAETDAGTAAGIVAGALNAFHLEGSQAAMIADQLAAGANASAASITDLSQGLQQAAFMFNATGQKSDDLIASLGILTNVGLTGSDAGTALKNAMVRLTNPTDKAAKLMAALGINVYDANGKMLPFREIIGVVNKGLSGMTDEQRNAALGTIFLSDGMKAMIPLLAAGTTGFDDMKNKVNQAGSAQNLAGAQTKGFTGATAALGNAMDTLKLIIGTQVLPLLTPLINQVADAVSTFGEWVQVFTKLIPAIENSDDPLRTFFNALRVVSPELNDTITSVQDFVDTVIAAATPIVNAALRIYNAFSAGGLSGAFDQIIAEIDAVIPQLLAELQVLVDQAYAWIQSQIPVWEAQLLTWGQAFLDWIAPIAAPYIAQLNTLISDTIAWIEAQPAILEAAFVSWATAFVAWIPGATVQFLDDWPGMLQSFLNWIASAAGPILAQLGTWAVSFVAWIAPAIPDILIALLGISLAIVTFIAETAAVILSNVAQWGLAMVSWIEENVIPGLPGPLASVLEIITGALRLVFDIVKTVFDLIASTIQSVLELINGDTEKAWNTFSQGAAHFTLGYIKIFVDAWNIIQSIFNLALDALIKAASDTWDGLQNTFNHGMDLIISGLNMQVSAFLNAGKALVDGIKSGFESAWNSFMAGVQRKLQELKDMLPFSEPKDHSSPLYGLAKSGAAIIGQIQSGIDSSSLTLPASIIGYDPTTGGIGTDQKKDQGAGTSIFDRPDEFPQPGAPASVGGVSQALIDLMRHIMVNPITPAQTANQAGGNTSYSNNTTLNMPIYTNQSPSVIQSSMAIAGAALT